MCFQQIEFIIFIFCSAIALTRLPFQDKLTLEKALKKQLLQEQMQNFIDSAPKDVPLSDDDIMQSVVELRKQSNLRNIGKVSEKLSPTEFESPDMPSVYQDVPLSLADMDAAVLAEAEKHK